MGVRPRVCVRGCGYGRGSEGHMEHTGPQEPEEALASPSPHTVAPGGCRQPGAPGLVPMSLQSRASVVT